MKFFPPKRITGVFLIVFLLAILLYRPVIVGIKTTQLFLEATNEFITIKDTSNNFKNTIPHQIELKTARKNIIADIYMPKNYKKKNPAIVFSYGSVDSFYNKKIVTLSTIFNHIGFIVLVPHIDDLAIKHVNANIVPDLVNSFKYLQLRGDVDKKHIGMMTFCVGGGFALIAAADPAIADDVAYVQTISPFYNLSTFAQATFLRQYPLNGKKIQWTPHKETTYTMYHEFLRVIPASEQETVHKAIQSNSIKMTDFEKLSPDSKALYKTVRGTSMQEKKENLARFISLHANEYYRSSPSQYVKNIKAPVFIASGGDPYIPISEAVALHQALPNTSTFEYFDNLDHVTFIKDNKLIKDIIEGTHLWLYLYRVMDRALP